MELVIILKLILLYLLVKPTNLQLLINVRNQVIMFNAVFT